ncbi:MAG: Crp/Fnr family transcriptional regulator [Saprospiraceae bacterium]|nr:Crp/Fnr family transcriptional regulator [Saprospiraceae bacterium]
MKSKILFMYDRIQANISRRITLTDAEFTHFTSFLHHKMYKKKEFMLKAGEIAKHLAFVNEGCFRTFTMDKTSEEHILQFSLEDWWVGDAYSALTHKPSIYYIEALEDSDVYFIEYQYMEQLFAEIPKFERYFRILSQGRFIALEERINDKLSASAEERYLNLLTRYPTLPQRVPQQYIASFLGIQPPSLSRIRKQLAEKNKKKE